MNKKCILSVTVLSAILIAANGCQRPQACLTADLNKQQGKLTEAVDCYEQCITELTSETDRRVVRETVEVLKAQIVDRAIAETRSLMSTAQNIVRCNEAISALEAKRKYDDKNGRIAALIEDCRRQKTELIAKAKRFLEMAGEQMNSQQWKTALSYVDNALAINPGDSEIVAMQQNIIDTRNRHYEQSIRRLCEKEDWQNGFSLLKDFESETPKPHDSILDAMRTLLADTKETAIRKIAKQLTDQRKYFTAYTTILDAKATKCEDLLEKIQEEGSRYYANLAREEKKNVRDFHAYVAAVKAKTLAPNSSEIFALHRDYADFVDDSIQVKIGIAAFGSPENEKDAGREFSDVLISHLSKRLPYGVKIDEREKIDFAIEKEGLKEAVKILGLNLAIFGNVSTLSVETQRSEREITDWVKIPQTTPNPDYEQEIAKMQRLYGYDKKNWPTVPPPFVTKEVPQLVKYKKGEVKMEGVMVVSSRIFSAIEGIVTNPETFTVTREVRDTFQEGVPQGNIPDDPLELPTTLRLKQDLRQDMVNKIEDWVLNKFSHRHRDYYERAQHFLERQEYNDAIKALAQGYLYCLNDKIPQSDECADKIRRLVLCDLTEEPTTTSQH
jgi:tetratricopeptide (TPR) repeat protein